MELNVVMSILNRDRTEEMEEIIKSLHVPFSMTMLGKGTATSEHLSLYGLLPTEKAVIATVADADETQRLMKLGRRRMFIDFPGNGIMMAVPLKSVGGGRTMAYLTHSKTPSDSKPSMDFAHELLYIIVNEGTSDLVMSAARPAGATGGTVIQARGTGVKPAEKFLGISLANEKEIIFILVSAQKKAEIMKAIMEKAGAHTPAGAICFSLPVTQVAGLREEDSDA